MLEKLGTRAFIAPFVVPVLIFLVFGAAISPLLMARMNDVPFAIVTLDEGSTLPVADVNIGDELTKRLMEGEGLGSLQDSDEEADDALGDVSIIWIQLASEEELRQALAENRYYGGIIIPADFTASQMMSATGLGSAPTVKVLLNDAKNPMLAQQMGPNLKTAMLQAGIAVEVEEVNAADIGGGMMAPMMSVQMLVMPLFIMTLVSSILLSAVTWPRGGASRGKRALALGKQLVIGAFLSAFIVFLALSIEVFLGGLALPVGQMFPFLWLACACIMAAIVGLCDLALPLGALAAITTFALGMSCAMLAYEMLPPFWQTWVYPWVPQHYLGDGVRSIVYLGADAIASGLWYWSILLTIGMLAMVLAILVPARRAEASQLEPSAGQAGSGVANADRFRAAIKGRRGLRNAGGRVPPASHSGF